MPTLKSKKMQEDGKLYNSIVAVLEGGHEVMRPLFGARYFGESEVCLFRCCYAYSVIHDVLNSTLSPDITLSTYFRNLY